MQYLAVVRNSIKVQFDDIASTVELRFVKQDDLLQAFGVIKAFGFNPVHSHNLITCKLTTYQHMCLLDGILNIVREDIIFDSFDDAINLDDFNNYKKQLDNLKVLDGTRMVNMPYTPFRVMASWFDAGSLLLHPHFANSDDMGKFMAIVEEAGYSTDDIYSMPSGDDIRAGDPLTENDEYCDTLITLRGLNALEIWEQGEPIDETPTFNSLEEAYQ